MKNLLGLIPIAIGNIRNAISGSLRIMHLSYRHVIVVHPLKLKNWPFKSEFLVKRRMELFSSESRKGKTKWAEAYNKKKMNIIMKSIGTQSKHIKLVSDSGKREWPKSIWLVEVVTSFLDQSQSAFMWLRPLLWGCTRIASVSGGSSAVSWCFCSEVALHSFKIKRREKRIREVDKVCSFLSSMGNAFFCSFFFSPLQSWRRNF